MNEDLTRQLLRRIAALERRLGIVETSEAGAAHSHSSYLNRDGSVALTADWDIGDGRKIIADAIRARDAAGLSFQDDGGNTAAMVLDGGIFMMSSDIMQEKSSGGVNARRIIFDPGDITRFQTLTITLTYSAATRIFNTILNVALSRSSNPAVWGTITGNVSWSGGSSPGYIRSNNLVATSSGTVSLVTTAITNGITVALSSSDFANTLNLTSVAVEVIGEDAGNVTISSTVA